MDFVGSRAIGGRSDIGRRVDYGGRKDYAGEEDYRNKDDYSGARWDGQPKVTVRRAGTSVGSAAPASRNNIHLSLAAMSIS